MFNSTVADQIKRNAEEVMDSTQSVASQAIDNVGRNLEHGMDRARDMSRRACAEAMHTSENAVGYIRHDPLKSVLIAAAAGAALATLVSVITRSSHRN